MRFLISIPEQLHAKLKAASKCRGQTLTGMIREILWDWDAKETDTTDNTEEKRHDIGRDSAV